MKKTKVFFMTMLVAVSLLCFSGTSFAFDLSKITSKPVEWVKYAAKRLGFGDSDKKKKPEAEPEHKTVAVKESAESAYIPESNSESTDLDPYEIDFESPFFDDDINNKAFAEGLIPYYYLRGMQGSGAGVNYKYIDEDWYFRLNSSSVEIFAPFRFESPDVQTWLTQMEYGTELPWKSIPFNVEFFLRSDFYHQQNLGLNDPGFEGINENFGFKQENLGYGFRVNTLFNDTMLSFYGWHGDDTRPLNPDYLYTETAKGFSDPLWLADNPGYQGTNNIAATLSYKLPFMNFSHEGMSPTVRLEAAYRFGANNSDFRNSFEDNDQWKVGLAYEGNSRIDWLNPYGINWGVGYNYTVTLNDLDIPDNLRRSYGSHSGNINANTYWFNMKLYTMFMYLYDRQTRGSMTVFNATYSPDWRWSYGIKANFYYGKKESDRKELNNNSEQVTFTATYRWD